MLKNTVNEYGIVAKSFHWLLFLMLSFSIVAGNFLTSIPKGAEKLQVAGFPISFFGLFEFPVFLDKDPVSADRFRSMHGSVWILLVLATIGHAGAAMHHHFFKKDNVLKQMTVGG